MPSAFAIVSKLREDWATMLAQLNKSLAATKEHQKQDAEFTASIDKVVAELQQYETGIKPILQQIEDAVGVIDEHFRHGGLAA